MYGFEDGGEAWGGIGRPEQAAIWAVSDLGAGAYFAAAFAISSSAAAAAVWGEALSVRKAVKSSFTGPSTRRQYCGEMRGMRAPTVADPRRLGKYLDW